MGKELETAVVTKAGTQGGGRGCAYMCHGLSPQQQLLWGKVGPAKQVQLGNQQVYDPGTSVLGFGFLFVFFCCVKEERESRKHDPFSNWLTQTLWDISWTPTPERGLRPAGPELKAPEKNQMLPTQRKLTFLACYGPPLPMIPTLSPLLSLPKEIHILSFIISF